MPTELRQLFFRPDEVITAVVQYHLKLKKPLPSGTALDCVLECDADHSNVRARMIFTPDLPIRARRREPSEEVVIGGAALAASLILYCRQLNIPLPTRAEKQLQLFDNQICLALTMAPRIEEPIVPPPPVMLA